MSPARKLPKTDQQAVPEWSSSPKIPTPTVWKKLIIVTQADFQSLRKVAKKESPTKKHKTTPKNSKKGSSSSKTEKWSTDAGSSEPSTRYLPH